MKLAVNGKIYTIRSGGERYIAGSGVKIEDSVISVTHPNVPLTQAEYDDLSPEEKTNGSIYIITDQEVQTNSDIYSLEETRVGTWIDGKPLYRKTYSIDSLSVTKNTPTWHTVAEKPAEVEFINAYGVIISGTAPGISRYNVPFVEYNGTNTNVATGAGVNEQYNTLWVYVWFSFATTIQGYVSFEYTKTTDSPEEVTTDGT